MAAALGVARSNLYERPEETLAKRGPYRMLADEDIVPLIVEIVDERPTYGYRRIWAVLNRRLRERNLPPVNHKRVYRLMKQNDLLLVSPPHRPDKRSHTSKIATQASDQRWCSDGFEITCENGEKVRAIFVLDCCDREVIACEASTGGFTSEMTQSALLMAIETRFKAQKAPDWLEWLTDNGSCFTAKDTLAFAKEVGIINCFTPVRSPESNGMAEAFVKTIKRDYAAIKSLPNARQTIREINEWIEDYNEYAPHKGLNWHSPRQFRRKAAAAGNFPGAARVTEAA